MGAAAGNGHRVDYLRAAGSVVAGIRAEAIRVRSDQRQSGEGVDAVRMCASASNLFAWRCGRNLVTRKSLAEAYNVLFPRVSVVRFIAADNVPNRSDERVVAVCRCLEWPQAVSGRL